jgi:hypothetical protein
LTRWANKDLLPKTYFRRWLMAEIQTAAESRSFIEEVKGLFEADRHAVLWEVWFPRFREDGT